MFGKCIVLNALHDLETNWEIPVFVSGRCHIRLEFVTDSCVPYSTEHNELAIVTICIVENINHPRNYIIERITYSK